MAQNSQTTLKLNNPANPVSGPAVFVDVLLPFAIEKPFTYRVPEAIKEAVQPGKRVSIQFGRKKLYAGLIWQVHNDPPKAYAAKYVLELLDNEPVINKNQFQFWEWMAGYYCAPLGSVMDAALPANLKLESEMTIMLKPGVNVQAEKDEVDVQAYEMLEILEVESEMAISRLAELLQAKQILKHVQQLHERSLISFKAVMGSGYKPKTESCLKPAAGYDNSEAFQQALQEVQKAPKQAAVLMAYQVLSRERYHVTRKAVAEKAQVSAHPIRALVDKGILEVYEREVERLETETATSPAFTLNEDQQKALASIKQAFTEKPTVLLYGVTGSGKTYLYMQLIAEVIENGGQALYLVPEIALTSQLIKRLRSYFGEAIGIYHSRFSGQERMETWYKVLNGQYQVILGVRSALFLPFYNLQQIIVDEEHEGTFKQQDPAPRYHARDAAVYLSQLMKGKTLLGTGTPSLESFYNARNGKYGLVYLTSRYGSLEMPNINIVNLKDGHTRRTMKSEFSYQLYQQLKNNLEQGYQNILFQNRRGYAPFIQCDACGWVPECENCDISLTYHKYFKALRCHLCGYHIGNPATCRACGSTALNMRGFGTEKLADELKTLFPDEKVLRLDQDTTTRKNAYQSIIESFENGEAGLLVGTQMVTKGLDFERVRLVGIVSADQMLKFPDFRAQEKSFQLMLQVSGRSGRKDQQGEVLIQTYLPEHPIFDYLQRYDFEGFYEHELEERYAFSYPPFWRMIRLTLKGKELEVVRKGANALAKDLRSHFGDRILGPELPPVMRVKNQYIMTILLKMEKQNRYLKEGKQKLIETIASFQQEPTYKKIRVNIDVDPLN